MNTVYLSFYRLYMTLKTSVLDRALRRWPRAQRGFNAAIGAFRRRIFPSREVWVQVQSGFARSMWMLLRIPDEAGFWRGEHEPDVQRAIATNTGPGDVIYDVGAHLGFLSLGAVRAVGATGRVVAFDADPANIARLRQHAERNQLWRNLQIVHAAVWSDAAGPEIAFRRGLFSFSQGGVEAGGHRPVLAGSELIHVPVITLDQFIATGNPPPQLIKIDVEGGEVEVLRGASHLFATHRPLLIVEVHHQQATDTLNGWLAEFRYSDKWKIPAENFPRHLLAWPVERPQSFRD